MKKIIQRVILFRHTQVTRPRDDGIHKQLTALIHIMVLVVIFGYRQIPAHANLGVYFDSE